VIGEHVESRALPSWHALTLQAMMERWSRTPRQVEIFAGADVFAQRGDASGKTIAKQYADHGIRLDPAAMDRVSGWGECLTLLGDPRRNIPSRIRIFKYLSPPDRDHTGLSAQPGSPGGCPEMGCR
jgi:hypothetical protein